MLLPRRSVGLALSGLAALGGVAVDGLAVGSEHTCVLLDDGSVKCFGLNDYGQLGQGDKDDRGGSAGTMGDDLAAVDFGARAPAVVAMSAGDGHTCVIFLGGTMKCFGKNNKGQLGQGDKSNRGDDPLEMGDNLDTVFLGSGRTAVSVSAEGDRTCAVLDSGDVRCWGDAGDGALGTGDEKNTGDGKFEVADTVDLGDIGAVTAIGSGPCAITEDGVMKCWGKGYYGKIGRGSADNAGDEPDEMGDALPAVPLGRGSLAMSMTAGRDFVCAVLEGGSLKCWGRAEGGQIGSEAIVTVGDDPDEMGDSLPTVDLGSRQVVVEVTAGTQHTCALLLSGAVKCWGKNFYGNLGLDDFRARGHAPKTMGDNLPEVDLGLGRNAVSIRSGGERTCAILDDGSLKCWGDNRRGELGLGDMEARGETDPEMGDSLPAVQLGTGRTAIALSRTTLATDAPPVAPTPLPTLSPSPEPTPGPTSVPPTPLPTVSLSPKPTPGPTSVAVTPAPIPVVATPSTPVPSAPTTSPTVPPPAPTTSPTVPGAPTTGPVVPTTSPSGTPAPTAASRSIPAAPTPGPVGITPSPVGPTPSPIRATPGPVETTPIPAEGTAPTITPSPSVTEEPEGVGGPKGPDGGTTGDEGTGAPEATTEPGSLLSPSSSATGDGGGSSSLAPVELVEGVEVEPVTDSGDEQEGGSSENDSGARSTIVASIAAPVGILSLIGIMFFLRRRRGSAPIAAKPDGRSA